MNLQNKSKLVFHSPIFIGDSEVEAMGLKHPTHKLEYYVGLLRYFQTHKTATFLFFRSLSSFPKKIIYRPQIFQFCKCLSQCTSTTPSPSFVAQLRLGFDYESSQTKTNDFRPGIHSFPARHAYH